jgi:hypothetical protein
MGAEFNAELERGRAIFQGLPPDKEPFTQLSDTQTAQGRAAQARGLRFHC